MAKEPDFDGDMLSKVLHTYLKKCWKHGETRGRDIVMENLEGIVYGGGG